MRCLESINKELRTLVAFQALSELKSNLNRDGSGEAGGGAYRRQSTEKRIGRLIWEAGRVRRSIEGLLAVEKRLEAASGELLAVIDRLEAGAVPSGAVEAGLKSVASALGRLASDDLDERIEETGTPSHFNRSALLEVGERLLGIAAGAGDAAEETTIAFLDEQLNLLLVMVETVSATISRLEFSEIGDEVMAANYRAMSVDSDSMVRAARELAAARRESPVRRVRKVS